MCNYFVGTHTISTVLNNLPERLQFELRLQQLLDCITRTNVYYLKMENYVHNTSDIEKSTLKDFANNVVSHATDSVASIVERIYTYIIPHGKGITDTGILSLLSKILEVR